MPSQKIQTAALLLLCLYIFIPWEEQDVPNSMQLEYRDIYLYLKQIHIVVHSSIHKH